MAVIDTFPKLKNEILSRLGSPVITVEITEGQVKRCVNRAITLFREYHPEGQNRFYGLCTLTAEEASTGVLNLAKPFMAVTAVKIPNNETQGWYPNAPFDSAWNQDQDLVQSMRSGSSSSCSSGWGGGIDNQMSNWEVYNSYIETFKNLFRVDPDFHFSQQRNQLKIFDGYLVEGQTIAIEGYVSSLVDVEDSEIPAGDVITDGVQDYDDPNEHSGTISTPSPAEPEQQYYTQKTLNDRWLQDFSTALCRDQWAQNIGAKYSGQQLPGGVTINADSIAERAEKDIAELREELLLIEAPLEIFLM